MDYKNFFTTNNLSGWKTKENYLKKNYIEIYNEIKFFILINNLFNLSFKEEVWYFINNIVKVKTCDGCDKSVKFGGTLKKGYNQFCSLECANNSGLLVDRVSNTLLKKYGVKYFPSHKSFISKVEKTKLEQYGDKNYNNMDKNLKTKEIRYDNKNYNNKDKSILTIREKFLKNLKNKTKDTIVKYGINDKNIVLNCHVCENNYEIYQNLFNYRTKTNIKTCTICNPIGKVNSIQEKELYEFVKIILPNEIILTKDRKILDGKELDIYIPSHNIAIEFDGLYWHSDKFLENNYHLNKTQECEKQGIQLIHIFEDEWRDKKDIVKNILRDKLGVYDINVNINETTIKKVCLTDTKLFLEINHLDGYTKSSINLGLYDNDNKLIAILCLNKLKYNNYKLVRICGIINININNGFNILLNYFIKTYNPNKIINYSDKRWLNNSLFFTKNFKITSVKKPSSYSIINHKRINKKTTDNNINNIYDCGFNEYILYNCSFK